jgi:UDP-galactopyranose mutase
MTTSRHAPDLLVLSHLRWDFVFQRPQHLLTRCAQYRRVYFMEEPHFADGILPSLELSKRGEQLFVAVPRLPTGLSAAETDAHLQRLVDSLIAEQFERSYILWYYTPMALRFTRHLKALSIVYDCMDELSHFKCAPPDLCMLEDELFRVADVVFTGGHSLYEYKRSKHNNVHAFPSSVDVAHFRKARAEQDEPHDQAPIARPRIGFTGVIDERFDIGLIGGLASRRPDWQFVMIGPVVKIDPAVLPRAHNIHYLGGKQYDELPSYLSGWDVAILPFARNEATRFISPTKTPEYLAAGRPVVSTSITDVVRSYGEAGLVHIADDAQTCVSAIETIMASGADRAGWLKRVDEFLSRMSWDETFRAMWQLVEDSIARRHVPMRAKLRSRGVSGAQTSPALGVGSVPAAPPG